MKKNKIVLYLFLLFSLLSCKQGINITIENDSYNLIDSLKIESDFINITHHSLKKGETFKTFVSSNKNITKVDGVFLMKLYSNRRLKKFYFGYYSNGILPENDIKVRLENDSVYIYE